MFSPDKRSSFSVKKNFSQITVNSGIFCAFISQLAIWSPEIPLRTLNMGSWGWKSRYGTFLSRLYIKKCPGDERIWRALPFFKKKRYKALRNTGGNLPCVAVGAECHIIVPILKGVSLAPKCQWLSDWLMAKATQTTICVCVHKCL